MSPSVEQQRPVVFDVIPSDKVGEVWAVVVDKIGDALERSGGRFLPEDVRENLEAGNMQLWVAYDGAVKAVIVTEILIFPRLKALSVFLVTGEDRKSWIANVEKLEEFGRLHGCVIIEAWARPGWQRVLTDWARTHILLEKPL